MIVCLPETTGLASLTRLGDALVAAQRSGEAVLVEFLATLDWSIEEVVGSTSQKLAMIYFTQQEMEQVPRVGRLTVQRAFPSCYPFGDAAYAIHPYRVVPNRKLTTHNYAVIYFTNFRRSPNVGA